MEAPSNLLFEVTLSTDEGHYVPYDRVPTKLIIDWLKARLEESEENFIRVFSIKHQANNLFSVQFSIPADYWERLNADGEKAALCDLMSDLETYVVDPDDGNFPLVYEGNDYLVAGRAISFFKDADELRVALIEATE